jgi:hypothetical protein
MRDCATGPSFEDVSESEDEDAAGDDERAEGDVGGNDFWGSIRERWRVAAVGRGEVWG